MDDLPTRWEVELEFVQSLANIPYVNYLAQNDYFSDPALINYLEYLEYWRQPQYAKHLVYPNCLHILTLLQSEEFRKSIVNPEFMNTLMNDMVKEWQNLAKDEALPLGEKSPEKSSEESTSNDNNTTAAVVSPAIESPPKSVS